MPKVNCSFVVCKHNSECDNSSAGILGVCNCKDDISLNYFDVTIGYNDEIEVDDSKIKTDVADEWKESGVVSGLSCNNFIFGRGRKNNA
jgi:hypothetical protein